MRAFPPPASLLRTYRWQRLHARAHLLRKALLKRVYRKGPAYRKAGVMLAGIVPRAGSR
jgi:hypothetical protein